MATLYTIINANAANKGNEFLLVVLFRSDQQMRSFNPWIEYSEVTSQLYSF